MKSDKVQKEILENWGQSVTLTSLKAPSVRLSLKFPTSKKILICPIFLLLFFLEFKDKYIILSSEKVILQNPKTQINK